MPEPQSAILPEPGESALFLVFHVPAVRMNLRTISAAIARFPRIAGGLSAQYPDAQLRSALGIGAEMWDKFSPRRRPAGLRPFKPVEAGARHAPATGGDILLHLHSRRPDLNFELANRLRETLGEPLEILDEVHGFRYLDSRDLTGFIDGTENPKGEERAAVALIGAEDPQFAVGSYAYTQRYVHDLARWATLSTSEQERIIGRRKADSEDLPDADKPATAHIRRGTIEENGAELKIVRHSFPYGTTTTAGLFFIAYTRDLTVPERMLHRLLGTSGDGVHDRLMDFTQAVSGAHFFVPSIEVLESLGS